MRSLCEKYAAKLVAQRLAEPGEPLIGGLDAHVEWNREDPRCQELAHVFDSLPVNSLVFSRPAEPYATILDFLASRHATIRPKDTETRTFLHNIPVCREFTGQAIGAHLKKRKSVIIPGQGVASFGTVSPEQGFVFYSSTLFSCFVLFFSEYLNRARAGELDAEYRQVFSAVTAMLPDPIAMPPALATGPFADADQALPAMAEAGRAVVDYGLVDSFFGNLSVRLGDVIHISQTGSSLDELEACIDPCPMDGSATTGLTASSELTAHEDVYRSSNYGCILHGHPKFSVIMSMDCARQDCTKRGQCHIHCAECRTLNGVPIVPGEVGTGPTGLCHTLPPAMAANGAAIVHGHGAFTAGEQDFNQAFARLLEIENNSRETYFEMVRAHA